MTALTPKQQAELARLYRETFRPLYAYALSALRDPALAEEAVQETFFIACAKIDYLLESPNPRGWLTLTVRNVTRMIFDRHANLKYKYGNRHFWCRGYYVDTVGRNEKAINEYVKNQLQEDIAADQISIKEYIDPFTGEPENKGK